MAMDILKRIPLRIQVKKPVRLGGRTYQSGGQVRWRDLGLSQRKVMQLIRLGYFEDFRQKPKRRRRKQRKPKEDVPEMESPKEEESLLEDN